MGWGNVPAGPRDQLVFYDQSKTYQMGSYASKRIFTGAYRERLRDHNPADFFTVPEPRPDLGVLISKLACESYLLENGIAQGDRLASVSSIEMRLPLVDYRIVETVMGLRKHRPDQHLPPKTWFRNVIKEYCPNG